MGHQHSRMGHHILWRFRHLGMAIVAVDGQRAFQVIRRHVVRERGTEQVVMVGVCKGVLEGDESSGN